MRFIWVALISLLISGNLYAKEIKIHGKLIGLEDSYVYLYLRIKNANKLIDSAYVSNEKFHFNVPSKELAIYYIFALNKKIVISIIPERSIRINGTVEKINGITVTGSKETNIFKEWDGRSRSLGFKWIRLDSDKQKCFEKQDTFCVNKLNPILDSLKREFKEYDFQTIERHPDSYTALFVLNKIYLELPLEKFEKYLGLIKRTSGNHSLYLSLNDKFNLLNNTRTGNLAPAFVVKKYLEQDSIRLSSLVDSFILLDFWGSWCGPCIRSIPDIKRIFREYKNKGLQVISVAYDEDKNVPELNKIIDQYKMDWIHGFINMADKDNPVLTNYSILAYPTYILIGPDRKILFRDNGVSNFDVLERILKENMK